MSKTEEQPKPKSPASPTLGLNLAHDQAHP
jgi:hypothetical protein